MDNFNSTTTTNIAMESSSSSSTGYLLQQVYTSLTQDLSLETCINSATLSTYANPQNIDCMVQLEMERIKENWARREEQYVEQMLVENPISIERRPTVNRHHLHTPQQQGEPLQSIYQLQNFAGATAPLGDSNALLPLQQQQDLQQQRADACRRSRYNNKIKKAKSKYRHKYMSQKLVQSTQMFNCIQDLIVQAESHLLGQGLTKEKLQQLRLRYGMDTATQLAVSKLDRKP